MPPHFKSLYALHKACHLPAPAHPQLSLFAFDKPTTAFSEYLESFSGDFYMIAMKKIKYGVMLYGRTSYDHQEGTMSFMKPGQLITLQNIEFEENGFVIAFHKDFINGYALFADIRQYGFFDYEVNEALHLSSKEREIMWELYRKVDLEYQNNQDKFSKSIILSHIDAILKYANRYYNRQFLDRATSTSSLLSRFNKLLIDWLASADQQVLPTVQALADKMNLSQRYLSDLLKHETGKTAIEHIHIALIDEAKNRLLGTEESIAETAYYLGFEHPTYFSRLFKKKMGISPKAYRKKFQP